MFVPCEKILIDQDNNLSVIAVFQRIDIAVPEPAKIPETAMSGFRWSVLTMFEREPDDESKVFEQKCELVTPTAKSTMRAAATLRMNHSVERVMITFHGFPVFKTPGSFRLKLYLRELGGDWQEIADFPMEQKHLTDK